MTRNEFIDNITEWCELKDFCNDFDCDICEDIYDDDDYDDSVEEDIRDAIADYGWGTSETSLATSPAGTITTVVTAPLIMMVSMTMTSKTTKRMSSNGAMTTAHGTTRKMKMKSTPMQMTTSSILWKRNPTKMKPLRKRISPSMTSSVCAV